jgi:hypothetical protein
LHNVVEKMLFNHNTNLTSNQLSNMENLLLFSQAIQHQQLCPQQLIDHPSSFFKPPKIDFRLILIYRIFLRSMTWK